MITNSTLTLLAQYRELVMLADYRNIAILEIYGDFSGALILSCNGIRSDVEMFYHIDDIDAMLRTAIRRKFEMMKRENRIETAIILNTLAVLAHDNDETFWTLYQKYDDPYNRDIPDSQLSDESYLTRMELRANCQ